jgi:hypothetical protein
MIDPLEMNVPEIGKKVESIPVTQVMEAMQSLEAELKEFYSLEMHRINDSLTRVVALHKSIEDHCDHCDTLYPCDTVKSINGDTL